MSTHYNAFISYRHHPEDIQAAEQIHKSLERYPLPRSLKKATGGIRRIFRDKEELPITSNLSEDIDSALRNSDFLIVICSTHTKESTWVQREIDLFLSTHDRNHVLTVLVNGEPYDVIPPCLLKETRKNSLTGKLEEVDLEPLSCDWRDKRKKIRSQELARLAAPLLGCSYDGLRQRQKHYKAQIRMAGVSVALGVSTCFLGYFLYSNHRLEEANGKLESANIKIQENLDTALKNQSTFLASASQDLLDSGDRMTAMALAMEALPEYEGQRPYVTAAEAALGNAVGIYNPSPHVGAVASFDAGALVQDLCVSQDGETLYVQDANNILSIWNTKTYEKIGTLEDIHYSFLYPTKSGNLIIWEDVQDTITCCNSRGEILWTKTHKGNLAIENQDDTLLLMDYDYDTKSQRLHFLDPDTGLPCRDPLSLTPDLYPEDVASPIQKIYGSRENLVFSIKKEDNRTLCGLLNPDTGRIKTFLVPQPYVRQTADGPNNTLLILAKDDSGMMNGSYNNILMTSPSRGYVYCYQKSSLKLLWVTPVETDIFTPTDSLQQIPNSDRIFCMNGDHCVVLDPGSGKILTQARMPGVPSRPKLREDNAVSFLEDGKICFFDYEDGSCSSTPIASGPLHLAFIRDGYYTAKDLSTQVTLHRMLQDENAVPYPEQVQYVKDCRIAEDQAAVLTEDMLRLFDIKNRTLLWKKPTENISSVLVGFSDDRKALWLYSSRTREMLCYHTNHGSLERFPLSQEQEGQPLFYHGNTFSCGGHFYVTCRRLDPQELLLDFDLNTREFRLISLADTEENSSILDKIHFLAGDETHILFWSELDLALRQLDLQTGEQKLLREQIAVKPYAGTLSGDYDYFLSTEDGLRLCSWEAGSLKELSLEAEQVVSCYIYGDRLLVLSENGQFHCCSFEGEILSSTKLHLYNSFYSELDDITPGGQDIAWYPTKDGQIILKLFRGCCILNCSDWDLSAFVPSVLQYLPRQDEFFIYAIAGSQRTMYTIPRYTRESLLSYARKELGTTELTPSQRKFYGLSPKA